MMCRRLLLLTAWQSQNGAGKAAMGLLLSLLSTTGCGNSHGGPLGGLQTEQVPRYENFPSGRRIRDLLQTVLYQELMSVPCRCYLLARVPVEQ